jgi:hypothetical protein
MLDKPLGQIGLADLRELITDKVREGKTIDYKQAMYLLDDVQVRDKQREELLKDVSSFANTVGGHLIIGMAEVDQIPTAILGVPIIDLDKEKNRLDQLIAQWLEPRINYDIHPIEVEPGKYVLVIRISQSLVSPHRVIYQRQFGQFWARNSTGAYPMDTSELRRAFNLSETIFEQIKGFRKQRVRLITEGEMPVQITQGPALALHLIPLSAFSSRVDFSLETLKRNAHNLFALNAQDRRDRVNIDGLVISAAIRRAYTQIFRNGVIEAVLSGISRSISEGKITALNIATIQQALLSALPNYLQFFQGLGIHAPISCFITLTQMKGIVLLLEGNYVETPPIDRATLYLPEATIEDLAIDARGFLRPLFDMIWNAAGWDESYDVTINGTTRWK